MFTIPKTLHLPLCNSATLFSDSLRVRINPEIKETGIQLEKTIKYRITQLWIFWQGIYIKWNQTKTGVLDKACIVQWKYHYKHTIGIINQQNRNGAKRSLLC
jgi:hypothetical protein